MMFTEYEHEMQSEWAYRAPSLSESHSQWHAVHGNVVCPLDCGIGEMDEDFSLPAQPQVSCGHCKGRHTVAGVAVCAATHHLSTNA